MNKSLLIAVVLCLAAAASAQSLVKKSIYKTDTADFGAGGTVSVTGAPNGSVSIESWNKNEIEVSAEIVLEAPTEADLAKLGAISGFVMTQDFNTVRITSVGTFDKNYLKRSAKNFPKKLVGLPLTVNYTLRVPRFCDVSVTGGKGDFKLSGVDGSLTINFLETNAKIELAGGALQATFGSGDVEISIPTRNWRGRLADVSLTRGDMRVKLPAGLNAEFDAAVLRTGKIENTFGELKPRNKKVPFTDASIEAKAGNGGVGLKFTVGDGTLAISGN